MKNNTEYTRPSFRKKASETAEQEGASILPGLKPVLELVQNTPKQVDSVFILKGRRDKNTDALIDACRAAGVRFSLVDDKTLSRLYAGRNQGVIARLFPTGFTELEDLLAEAVNAPLPLIIALDQVADPGNAGTIIRTLYAMGCAGLIIPKHQGAYLGAAAAKAAAGAMERTSIAKVTNLSQALDKAEEEGFTIYGAATGAESISIFDAKPNFPAILVLGSEGSGLRHGIAKRCQQLFSIPMKRDFDSLNVAQAGAIMIAELSHAADFVKE